MYLAPSPSVTLLPHKLVRQVRSGFQAYIIKSENYFSLFIHIFVITRHCYGGIRYIKSAAALKRKSMITGIRPASVLNSEEVCAVGYGSQYDRWCASDIQPRPCCILQAASIIIGLSVEVSSKGPVPIWSDAWHVTALIWLWSMLSLKSLDVHRRTRSITISRSTLFIIRAQV